MSNHSEVKSVTLSDQESNILSSGMELEKQEKGGKEEGA